MVRLTQKLLRQMISYGVTTRVQAIFDGALDNTYFKGVPPVGRELLAGDSFNYTLAGTLMTLPLDRLKEEKDRPGYSPSGPQPPSVTLQHHLWVYLDGLDKMKEEFKTAGQPPISLPHGCDETSRKAR
jgi:hypothetical protein